MWSAANTRSDFITGLTEKWELLAQVGVRVSRDLLDPTVRLGPPAVQALMGPTPPAALLLLPAAPKSPVEKTS